MSDKDVPFDEKAKCDDCGKLGAYDFMGDFLCSKCASKVLGPPEPCNRCGCMSCICGE